MRYFISALTALLVIGQASAQTIGIGYITSMEGKASSIESLKAKIEELEQQMKVWREERDNIDSQLPKKIARRLAEIKTDRVWMNRLESAQRGYKEYNPGSCSAGGPPPICTADHWYKVSVSDALAEYEALKQKELDKIREQSEKLKESYDRRIENAQKEVAKIYDDIDKLKLDIVQLSKDYKEAVVKEAGRIQLSYLGELMRIVAEKHFIEDRINIITVKITELNQEETKAISESDEKVRKQVEEEKQKLKNSIESNNGKLKQLLVSFQTRISPLRVNDTQLKQRLGDTERKLQSRSSLTTEQLETLENQKRDTEAAILELKSTMESYENDYISNKAQIEQESKEFADKVWDLTVNLSKRQQETADALRKAFALRRKILEDAKAARQTNLQMKGDLLLTKKAAARKKFMEYAAEADKERVRLIRACEKAGCNCYGVDTHGTIVSNWNQAENCVGEMECAHFTGDVVYGCEEESAIYKQHYSSLINGLSDSEIQALQKQNGKVRYDLILRKIAN